jgi:hypothetical protein
MIRLRSLDALRAVFAVPADASPGAALYRLDPVTDWWMLFDGADFAVTPLVDGHDAAMQHDFLGLLMPDGRVLGRGGEWPSLQALNEHLRTRAQSTQACSRPTNGS